MKKQSDLHTPQRVRESETVATTIPAPAFTTSKPRGVQDHAHPGHLDRGAAESRTNPVKDTHEVSRTGSASRTGSVSRAGSASRSSSRKSH